MGLERSSLTIHHDGRVVIDAKEVDRCGDGGKVPVLGCRFDASGDAAVRMAEIWISALSSGSR
jgi:hypothetical protein